MVRRREGVSVEFVSLTDETTVAGLFNTDWYSALQLQCSWHGWREAGREGGRKGGGMGGGRHPPCALSRLSVFWSLASLVL